MQKRSLKALIILCVIGVLCLLIAAGVLYLSSEKPNDRQEVIIYTPQGALTEGYKSFTEYSNDKTLQNSGNMPNYINGADTSVFDNASQNTVNHNFCGNKNSKVYHKSGCTSLSKTKEENKVYFSTKEEYINNGYKPCSRCNP